MARSRCLAVYWGILGLADSRKRSLHEPVSTRAQDWCFFFFAQHFGRGVFLMGKTINDRFANKELRPSGICLGATWAGIFCYTEIADLWRLGFIYTEFADAWRLDFIYTEIADTLVVEGLARRRHCFCFIPDASKISSSFSCRFFLS